MGEHLCQKVIWSRLQMREADVEQINNILNEGYEISDIVPYMTESGGGIYTIRRGLYISGLLFIFSPSNKKTVLHYHSVTREKGLTFVDKINEIIKQENEMGWVLYRFIPGTAIVEPMNGNGLGKGTHVFCMFFIGLKE